MSNFKWQKLKIPQALQSLFSNPLRKERVRAFDVWRFHMV